MYCPPLPLFLMTALGLIPQILAGGCQLTLIFCFVGATYVRLYHEVEREVGEEIVQGIMGFSSTTVIATPVVVVTLAMLLVMLVIVIDVIRREERQPSIRLVDTRTHPVLTLEKGQKWHLFLSHIWSTGASTSHSLTGWTVTTRYMC